jgi:hypothetical protein
VLASLPGQTPSTRRVAPDPVTRTLEKPKARNFLAISSLSASCSTDLSERVARYLFPFSTVNSPAKLEMLTKLAAMAKAGRAFRKFRTALLVMQTSSCSGFSGAFGSSSRQVGGGAWVEATGGRSTLPSDPK